jgi:hypothetical protein
MMAYLHLPECFIITIKQRVSHLLIKTIEKAIDFLPELFPELPKGELDEIRQLLVLERVVKFCQMAENLGAFAFAFNQSFDDEKQEILEIFNIITTYHVDDVVNFYTALQRKNLQYVAKFIGYPLFRKQTTGAKAILEMSCRNVKEDMVKIGSLYDELRLLYDAYKHGYRISLGKDNNTHEDVIVYIDKNKHQKVLLLTKTLLKDINNKTAACFHILNVILSAHQHRVKFEASGLNEGRVVITIYRKKTDPRPKQEDLILSYPKRGERLKQEMEEIDKVYNEFKDELEKEHLYDFVAIDIDEHKIVLVNPSLEKLRMEVQAHPRAGRIAIRQIGRKARVPRDFY